MKKSRHNFNFRIGFFIIALAIATLSFIYTNNLVKKLKAQEKWKIELWADSYLEILNTDIDQPLNPISFKIINENKTIPVIMTDENNRIISFANLDSLKAKDSEYLYSLLEKMKSEHKPIIIKISDSQINYIYYENSALLYALENYPIFQAILVILFVLVAYFLSIFSQRAKDNQVLVGMAKETAHQLGTPISSLMAWVEFLKIKSESDPMIDEVEKDVKRLVVITERFSRIGSLPKRETHNLEEVINEAINYLKRRTSSQVKFIFEPKTIKTYVSINNSLFQWVIENVGKNAIDAMAGKGEIVFDIKTVQNKVLIDISDNGKGMSKKEQRKVFSPGFSTKKYGWGMGLTLVKRIVEEYHNGKIFILHSAPNQGTIFRIELPLLFNSLN